MLRAGYFIVGTVFVVMLLAAAVVAVLVSYAPASAATEDTTASASTEKNTIETSAAVTPDTDVYCDFASFDNCANDFDLSAATERFNCGGFVQTNNVTCTSKKTGKTYFCDYEGGDPFSGVDLYFCELPPPNVVSTVPTDGTTNVDRDANIKAKFSTSMDKSSINTDTVYLTVTGCQAPCEHVPSR